MKAIYAAILILILAAVFSIFALSFEGFRDGHRGRRGHYGGHYGGHHGGHRGGHRGSYYGGGGSSGGWFPYMWFYPYYVVECDPMVPGSCLYY